MVICDRCGSRVDVTKEVEVIIGCSNTASQRMKRTLDLRSSCKEKLDVAIAVFLKPLPKPSVIPGVEPVKD